MKDDESGNNKFSEGQPSISKSNPKYHFVYNNPKKLKGEEILDYDFSEIATSKIDSVLKVLLIWDQEFRIKSARARELELDQKIQISIGYNMKKADSLNYIIISKIIEEMGWPSKNIYSDSAIAAPYYIIYYR